MIFVLLAFYPLEIVTCLKTDVLGPNSYETLYDKPNIFYSFLYFTYFSSFSNALNDWLAIIILLRYQIFTENYHLPPPPLSLWYERKKNIHCYYNIFLPLLHCCKFYIHELIFLSSTFIQTNETQIKIKHNLSHTQHHHHKPRSTITQKMSLIRI
jgi:hypothetical protein